MKKRCAAAGVALALVMCLSVPSYADKRSDALEQREAADQQIADLQHELEGLSSDLAQVYVDLEKVNIELPVVEAELAAAQETAAAAEREHDQVLSQLTAAQGEYERITGELTRSKDEAEELQTSIASMARDLYRGGETSALTLLLTTEGPGDITDRATAAESVTRAQSRTLESVREEAATLQNQALKQDAATERISALEAEAAEALSQAEAAEEAAAAKQEELEALQASLESKEKAWAARKDEAVAQLQEQEKARTKADEIIAKIDAENQKKAEEEARKAAEAANQGGGAAPASPSSGAMFSWPVPAGTPISSSYGMRLHPILGIYRLHDGTDFAGGCGSPQYAIAAGTVEGSYYDSGGGNMVIINHGNLGGNSWISEHLHLDSAVVSQGQSVSQGQLIGYTGTTGNSTGCHLHFTMYQNGSTVNPMDYLG
ncbi:M23 family metallopeptidase [Scrofimicrobium canadense]|nr:M23 family metallopeptidase [Scrofimicrobium canadense]